MRFCLSQRTVWIEMCVKHNAEAYSTVMDMLEKVGKAAVIHSLKIWRKVVVVISLTTSNLLLIL